MIKYIRDEGEDRPVSRIVFNNSLFYPIYISSSEKDEKDETLDRTFCFSSSFIHSFERRVELTVEKKKESLFPMALISSP